MDVTEKDQGTDSAGRRRKRFLTPQEKYEIWLRLLRKEATIAEAASKAGVDPATVMKLREVAKQACASCCWREKGAGTRRWPGPTPGRCGHEGSAAGSRRQSHERRMEPPAGLRDARGQGVPGLALAHPAC